MKWMFFVLATFILAGCSFSWEKQNGAGSTRGSTGVTHEKQCTIVALGDSLTAWYNLDVSDAYPAQLEERLKEAGYNVHVVNAWVSGDTVRNISDRLPFIQKAYPEATYLVEAWANDGLSGRSVEGIRAELEWLVKTIKTKNKLVLLGQNIPTNYGTYARSFETMYESLSKQEKVPFIPLFLKDVGGVPSLNLWDGIHPTREWYAKIAERISKEPALLDIITSCK